MPEWTLWLIPCVFALVFGYTVAAGALRSRRPRIGEQQEQGEVCPSGHRDAVSVEDVDGELVAWLCVDPDCGEQLPKAWRRLSVDGWAVDFPSTPQVDGPSVSK